MPLSTGALLLEVLLSPEAEQDFLEIYSNAVVSAGQEQADMILSKLLLGSSNS